MFIAEQFPLNSSFEELAADATIGQLLSVLERGQAALLDDECSAGGEIAAGRGKRRDRAILALPQERAFLGLAFSDRLSEKASPLLAESPFRSAAMRLTTEQSAVEAVLSLKPTRNDRPVLFRDEGGTWLGYACLQDLLAHAVSEQRRWQAYFETLAETVSDAVTVVDRNGEVICWNPAAEDIYDLPRSALLGKRIGEHFAEETLMVLKILDEGRLIRNTYHRPREDTHVLINASPVRDPQGTIIGGIAAEQDITQLVKLNGQLTSAQTFSHQHKSDDRGLFSFLKGTGPALGKVMQWAKKIAAANTPVLLTGEGGSGKEQLAQIIHASSPRAGGAFLSANCGIVPAGLLESELFGFQGGAFSGSEGGEPGLLEQAKDGTLFISEIDRLPLELQAKLFRYLSRQTFQRIGGTKPIGASARIIAATTADLAAMIREGSFRADLYYALNVVSIAVPPLRERREDIPSMLQMYLKQFSLQYQKPLPALSPEVMLAFANYDWPGNILELRNIVERCILLCEDELITMEQLPEALQARQPSLEPAAAPQDNGGEPAIPPTGEPSSKPYAKPLKASAGPSDEQRLVRDALARTAGNKSAAAKLLGVSRGTLYNKLKELGIE